MATNPTTTTNSQRLEIHVLGAAQGESIVLRLPDGKWGVVDCYAKSLKDPSTNPTLSFLRQKEVQELEFLCLTHPHDDHFRGMSHLLEQYGRIRYFWRFGGLSGQHFRDLVQYYSVDAERSGAAEEIENSNEFTKIFTLVAARRRETSQKRVVGTQQLYPVPVDPSAAFQIWSLAPSGNEVARYEEGLLRCFAPDGMIRGRLRRAHHNIVSAGLSVEFGETRVILGGDVESQGWNDAIQEYGHDRLASHAIKVSHHGSSNGYTEDLWSHFSAQRQPIAVITPFRKVRLPQREALNHIRGFTASMVSTCLPAIDEEQLPVPLSPDAPVNSREAMRDNFQAWSGRNDAGCGRCSFVFDDTGNCVFRELIRPAGEITE